MNNFGFISSLLLIIPFSTWPNDTLNLNLIYGRTYSTIEVDVDSSICGNDAVNKDYKYLSNYIAKSIIKALMHDKNNKGNYIFSVFYDSSKFVLRNPEINQNDSLLKSIPNWKFRSKYSFILLITLKYDNKIEEKLLLPAKQLGNAKYFLMLIPIFLSIVFAVNGINL